MRKSSARPSGGSCPRSSVGTPDTSSTLEAAPRLAEVIDHRARAARRAARSMRRMPGATSGPLSSARTSTGDLRLRGAAGTRQDGQLVDGERGRRAVALGQGERRRLGACHHLDRRLEARPRLGLSALVAPAVREASLGPLGLRSFDAPPARRPACPSALAAAGTKHGEGDEGASETHRGASVSHKVTQPRIPAKKTASFPLASPPMTGSEFEAAFRKLVTGAARTQANVACLACEQCERCSECTFCVGSRASRGATTARGARTAPTAPTARARRAASRASTASRATGASAARTSSAPSAAAGAPTASAVWASAAATSTS